MSVGSEVFPADEESDGFDGDEFVEPVAEDNTPPAVVDVSVTTSIFNENYTSWPKLLYDLRQFYAIPVDTQAHLNELEAFKGVNIPRPSDISPDDKTDLTSLCNQFKKYPSMRPVIDKFPAAMFDETLSQGFFEIGNDQLHAYRLIAERRQRA